MAPSIVVDPYLYSPPKTNDVDELRGYVDAVLYCDGLNRSKWPRIFNTGKVAQILAETGSFPPLDRISEIIQIAEVDYIQAQDLSRLVNGLVSRLPTIEEAFGIEDVLLGNCIINPEEPLISRPGLFREVLEFVIGLSLLGNHIVNGPDVLILISRDLPIACPDATVDLSVDASVPDVAQGPTLPCSLSGTVHWCGDWESLRDKLDVVDLWVAAENAESHTRSLAIGVEKKKQVADNELDWNFGNEFLLTAANHGFLHNPSRAKLLIRACAETILQIDLSATHKLRKGPGPSEAQITNGEHKAFRRDIDYDFHLHYWQAANSIQFASVVIHADMTIPDPN